MIQLIYLLDSLSVFALVCLFINLFVCLLASFFALFVCLLVRLVGVGCWGQLGLAEATSSSSSSAAPVRPVVASLPLLSLVPLTLLLYHLCSPLFGSTCYLESALCLDQALPPPTPAAG